MDAQVAHAVPLQATRDYCTFAVHEIRAIEAGSDRLGGDRFGSDCAWYEALIRPRGPHTHWSPGDFVEQLYRDDPPLTTDLEVLRRLGAWLIECNEPTRVSVNTHPESLTRSLFVNEAMAIQRRAAQGGHSLCLELIEFGYSREKASLVANAQALRRAGVLIALDDFGSRINCFDLCATGIVDLLKIDITVVRGVHVDRNQRAIVESIKTLGNGLGARVIAEGVETLEQLETLRHLEVEYAQGFYFQKPQLLEI